jgi:hypothetical protein
MIRFGRDSSDRGISGSAIADAAALGPVPIRSMKREGYPPGYAAALVQTPSTKGPIIRPSIPAIVYAVLLRRLDRGDDPVLAFAAAGSSADSFGGAVFFGATVRFAAAVFSAATVLFRAAVFSAAAVFFGAVVIFGAAFFFG